MAIAITFYVVFYKHHTKTSRYRAGGFTLVEAVVAIAVLGIGVACTVGGLTKMNQIASISRVRTGVNAALLSQIDLFQSVGPFVPKEQKVPWDSHNPPLYDMRTGTNRKIGYQDPVTKAVSDQWPVYQYANGTNSVVVVPATLTETVTSLTNAFTVTTDISKTAYHQAVFTITYKYLGKDYSISMSTIRASDT